MGVISPWKAAILWGEGSHGMSAKVDAITTVGVYIGDAASRQISLITCFIYNALMKFKRR